MGSPDKPELAEPAPFVPLSDEEYNALGLNERLLYLEDAIRALLETLLGPH